MSTPCLWNQQMLVMLCNRPENGLWLYLCMLHVLAALQLHTGNALVQSWGFELHQPTTTTAGRSRQVASNAQGCICSAHCLFAKAPTALDNEAPSPLALQLRSPWLPLVQQASSRQRPKLCDGVLLRLTAAPNAVTSQALGDHVERACDSGW